MMILNLKDELLNFLEPIVDFFKSVWQDIQNFCLQYMSQDVFNIFIFALIIGMIMLVALAIINRD
ncbi:hypothetical protein EGP91_03450 [bacterium]|uniref:hypothetical protein n=1 Tax=Candidatus Ventrenecus sp. TaxID=3085654 RepID=UPI001DD4BC18|nr:hypothetical protein [bacterium]